MPIICLAKYGFYYETYLLNKENGIMFDDYFIVLYITLIEKI